MLYGRHALRGRNMSIWATLLVLELLEKVYSHDRQNPELRSLLVRTVSDARRELEYKDAFSGAASTIGDGPHLEGLESKYNIYLFMGLNYDFTEKQLKLQYRRLSKVFHPDSKNGSQSLFSRLGEASEVLTNSEKRKQYSEGDDLERETLRDGSLGDSIKVQVLKTYFPEEFGYEPFGDPFESKRRFELERRRKEKPKANGHGIPTGTY